ncbi:MAG: hypothetical protein OEX04_19915 [Acidimicrobiia bacterium]|nr:hypothetical protein [Acidimicrobiia bacterium]
MSPAYPRETTVRNALGLNPFRPQSKTTFDIAMVIGAIVLTLVVIGWALFGG